MRQFIRVCTVCKDKNKHQKQKGIVYRHFDLQALLIQNGQFHRLIISIYVFGLIDQNDKGQVTITCTYCFTYSYLPFQSPCPGRRLVGLIRSIPGPCSSLSTVNCDCPQA